MRTFLEAWHARTVVFNGLMVRSIAHEICTMIAMTGTTSGLRADWPAILAGEERDRYTLPHLVLGGPSFPGDLGVAVLRLVLRPVPVQVLLPVRVRTEPAVQSAPAETPVPRRTVSPLPSYDGGR